MNVCSYEAGCGPVRRHQLVRYRALPSPQPTITSSPRIYCHTQNCPNPEVSSVSYPLLPFYPLACSDWLNLLAWKNGQISTVHSHDSHQFPLHTTDPVLPRTWSLVIHSDCPTDNIVYLLGFCLTRVFPYKILSIHSGFYFMQYSLSYSFGILPDKIFFIHSGFYLTQYSIHSGFYLTQYSLFIRVLPHTILFIHSGFNSHNTLTTRVFTSHNTLFAQDFTCWSCTSSSLMSRVS